MKYIEANHPVHPITKKPFNIGDRVEVKQFFVKLLDPCNLNRIIRKCFKCLKSYRKYALKGGCFSKNEDQNQVKPEPRAPSKSQLSLVDADDDQAEHEEEEFSDSSSFEDEGGFGGLDAAGANIGNGAGLYLQMMKTFTFLFFVLSLINIPIYNLYQGVTRNNNYIDVGMSYLTLGNLAETNPTCSYAKVLPVASKQESFDLKCVGEYEYLSMIDDYGLSYVFDLGLNQESEGREKCPQIMSYKKPSQLSAGGRML